MGWEEGTKIEANYRGRGKYYPGIIKRDRGDGTYDIDYDDGEEETKVRKDYIRSYSSTPAFFVELKKLKAGTRVEANYRGKGKYYPGAIKVDRGENKYDIVYDDGEEEFNVLIEKIRLEGGVMIDIKLKKGDRIEANYRGRGKYYPGIIKRDRGDGTYDIDYDGGEAETGVREDDIRLIRPFSTPATFVDITELKAGTRVEANYRDQGKYYPGAIKVDRGENKYDIVYDDGEEEFNVLIEKIRLEGGVMINIKLKEGDGIVANYRGGGIYYPGIIKRDRGDGTYDIDYDVGDTETGVKRELIRCQNGFRKFAVGDRVRVNYRGRGYYYDGSIREVGPCGTFDINYDDGTHEWLVKEENIRALGISSIREGSRIEANYGGRGKYYSGKIKRDIGDGTFDIDYDDGEKEVGVKRELIRRIGDDTCALGMDSLKVGERVEVDFRGKSVFFLGRIKIVNENNTYDIDYDDGDSEMNVGISLIRPYVDKNVGYILNGGTRVEAAYRHGGYFPGRIKRYCGDGSYDIDFDDGDKEQWVPLYNLKINGSPLEVIAPQIILVGTKVKVNSANNESVSMGYVTAQYPDGSYDVMFETNNQNRNSNFHGDQICVVDDAINKTGGMSISEEAVLDETSGAVTTVCFTSEGKKLFSSNTSRTISTWDLKTKKRAVFNNEEIGTAQICCSPNKIHYVTSDGDKLRVENIKSNIKNVTRIDEGTVRCLCFSPDGKQLFAGTNTASIYNFQFASGKMEKAFKLRGHIDAVLTMCISAENNYLISGSADNTICIWNLISFRQENILSRHLRPVCSICLSPNDEYLFSASSDKTIRVWNWKAGLEIRVLYGHLLSVNALVVSPDGAKLVSASSDYTLRVWDLNGLEDSDELSCEVHVCHTNAVLTMDISSDGKRIATGGADGTVRIWRTTFKGSDMSHHTANAVNDSSRIGVDRLGFTAYAQAMYSVLSEAEPPVCVGLYARWGSGKSFMIQLLKYYFDKTVSVRKATKELVQWYEEGWFPPVKGTGPKQEANDQSSRLSRTFCDKCSTRVHICSFLFWKAVSFIKFDWLIGLIKQSIESFFPNENYFLGLIWELFVDIAKEWNGQYCQNVVFQVRKILYSCYHGDDYTQLNSDDFEDAIVVNASSSTKIFPRLPDVEEAPRPISEREYLFVDFNAWEFSRSDELWAGLIRNIYLKVELRLSQHNSDTFRVRNLNANEYVENDCKAIDWKQIWRVKKAKELLIRHYGGSRALRLRLIALFFLTMGVITTIVLSALGIIDIWTRLVSGVAQTLSVVAGLIGVIIAAVPSIRLLHQTNHSVNTSRGDVIFKEANRVQDSIGFLSRVRGELDELFQFMRKYETETNTRLILVIFVDDLDRCLEGRNVKVLEAIQLILAIPGAPVIAFLAIDSRVVVASIEAMINKSLSIRDALISGYEYMDKIVQVPFCLPEAPEDKVKRYIDSCIVKSADPVSVKKMMDIYFVSVKAFVQQMKKYESLDKLTIVYSTNGDSYEINYDALVKILKEYQSRDSVEDCIEMLLALAALFPTTQRYVNEYQISIGVSQDSINAISKDEVIEMMCSSIIRIVNSMRFKDTFITFESQIKLPQKTSLFSCGLISSRPRLFVASNSTLWVLDESTSFAPRQTVQLNDVEERIIVLRCIGDRLITFTSKGNIIWFNSQFARVNQVSRNSIIHSDVCAINATSSHMFLGCKNGNIVVLKYDNNEELIVLSEHEGPITSLAHSLHGGLLVSGSEDCTLCAWYDAAWSIATVFKGHTAAVRQVCFSQSYSPYIISASDDKTIRIWSLESKSVYRVLSGHFDSVWSVCVTTDDAHIISGSADKTVRVWNVETGEQQLCLMQHIDWVTVVKVFPEGNKFVSCSRDGMIYVWSLDKLSNSQSKSFDDIAKYNNKQPSKTVNTIDSPISMESSSMTSESEVMPVVAKSPIPIKLKEESVEPSNSVESTEQVATNIEKERSNTNDKSEPITTYPVTLQRLTESFLKRFQSEINKFIAKSSLPTEMHLTLNSLCSTSESNPRRLKRVLNVILIAYEVAKCKVESEESDQVIANNILWPEFSARLTKWIFLCELYPYRMSFLVQSLMDLEQKKLFNRQLLGKLASKEDENNIANKDAALSDKFQMPLLYYKDLKASAQDEGEPEDKKLALLDADNISIGEFFFFYVEQYLYAINSSEKLMRLDGDPELFATLLYATIKLDQNRVLNIRCLDVLGPLKDSDGKNDKNYELSSLRDKNFSLMTYAFNLNPSMSKQIGIELQEIRTQYELVKPCHDPNNPEQQNEVILKQSRPQSFKADISKGNSNSIEKKATLSAAITARSLSSSSPSSLQSSRNLQPTSPVMQQVPIFETTNGSEKSNQSSPTQQQNSSGEASSGLQLEVSPVASPTIHDLDDCDENTPLLS